jgi:hypothetical protein
MEAERGTVWLVTPLMDELQDDVLTALDRAEAVGEDELFVRLAAASGYLFSGRALLGPGRAWLQRALDLAAPEQRGSVHVALAGVEMIRGSFGAMWRHAGAARTLLAADPPREAVALFYELMFATYADPAAATPLLGRARELLAGGLPANESAMLRSSLGGYALWHEQDDLAIATFDEGRRSAHIHGTAAAIAATGYLVALVFAHRVEEIDRLLRDEKVAEQRRVWRDAARRGEQWTASVELAVAVATAARGDPGGARRLVADVHLLLGRERISGVDADLLAALAAICLHDGDEARALALLAGTLWVGRTPPTTALAYRTLAAAAHVDDPNPAAWRSQELMRRYELDHATLDTAARRMLDDEFARLGLV